jgi:tetratricopeptide (TPR) repeat protein
VVGDIDRTMAAAERLGWATVPGDLLQAVVAAALAAGKAEALERLAALGEERLASSPVLLARLRLAVGDAEGAQRWSDRAAETLAGKPELALQLAELELQLKRRDRAGALLLGPVLTDPALPPAALPTVARLLIQAGRAGEGAAALATLRQSQPSAATEEAWALAAAAAGHGEAVATWLADPEHAAPAVSLLQDLLHLALDAGARGLALPVAERLVRVRGHAEDGLLLARLLFEAKQPQRALERLRALPPGTAVPEDLHDAVLVGAWRQGAPVAAEMRGLARQRLAAAATPAEREAAIALLLELRAHAEVLPVLRELASETPGRWLWTYSSVAAAAGRPGDAAALWAELALRPGVPADLRRQLAFRLLEAGDKRSAERAFRSLAATAASESPDVRQLLFLWGPRPSAEQLAWIEARARGAGGAEQGAWMRILTDRGAPARAIAVHRAGARHDVPETTIEAYLSALEAQDDRNAMAAAVREELPRAQSAKLWRQLARMAARAGDTALERQAIERLVAVGEGGPEAQRRLGMLAHLRREQDTAERLLLSFVAATGGDDESWMILGDIATRRRDHATARQRYTQALQRLEASRETFRSRVVRAHLLHRLGREAEAARLYEALLTERPRDQSLRADYVAMLMEQGAVQHAHDVLAGR